MAFVDQYLSMVLRRGATRLVLRPNMPPLVVGGAEKLPAGDEVHPRQVQLAVREILPEPERVRLAAEGQLNTRYTDPHSNTEFQLVVRPCKGGIEAVFALIGEPARYGAPVVTIDLDAEPMTIEGAEAVFASSVTTEEEAPPMDDLELPGDDGAPAPEVVPTSLAVGAAAGPRRARRALTAGATRTQGSKPPRVSAPQPPQDDDATQELVVRRVPSVVATPATPSPEVAAPQPPADAPPLEEAPAFAAASRPPDVAAPAEAPAPARELSGGESGAKIVLQVEPERSAVRGECPAIEAFLRKMVKDKASDLHLCTARRPAYRIDGDLERDETIAPFSTEDLRALLGPLMRPSDQETLASRGSADFAYEIPSFSRYRFNVYRDYRGVAVSIRQIPTRVLTAQELGLPRPIRDLAALPKGLVLVTGPTGSGKSTTLAALVDLVNRTRTDHIITIESPIEFVHQDHKCLVNQREVGLHTTGFKDALRDALREDPDVVLVGELRDLETISTAMETANTGHLVFGTLHTTTATTTVNRIIESFPPDQQTQIRYSLAESLKAVIAQTLLKKIGGGRVAALEVLLVLGSVANLIREQKTHQLLNIMQTNKGAGMQLLTEELVKLVKSNTVEAEEAYRRAVDKKELLRQFQMAEISWRPAGADMPVE